MSRDQNYWTISSYSIHIDAFTHPYSKTNVYCSTIETVSLNKSSFLFSLDFPGIFPYHLTRWYYDFRRKNRTFNEVENSRRVSITWSISITQKVTFSYIYICRNSQSFSNVYVYLHNIVYMCVQWELENKDLFSPHYIYIIYCRVYKLGCIILCRMRLWWRWWCNKYYCVYFEFYFAIYSYVSRMCAVSRTENKMLGEQEKNVYRPSVDPYKLLLLT